MAEYNFDACSVKLGFCDPPTGGETKTVVELIPISEADREGRRRDKDDWTYTLTSEPALFADRGFTGHEYLEDFKLYNMNGRMYDPVVGRFLNVDPYVQDPGNTQSYNRYSYCLNNPLKYIDPSGNTWWSKFWNWTDEKGIQFGINIGPGGRVPNISAPGPGNTRVSVGVNTQTGLVGIGNNSSGFMNFYYPGYNYDAAAQNISNNVIPSVRGRYGAEWHANSVDVLRPSIYASSTIFNLLNSIEEINAGLNYSANLSRADAWKSVGHRYSKSLSSNLEFSKISKTLTKSVSTKLTFVGVIYTTYDVSQNFTGENVAWGTLDTSIGILGIISGYATIPAVLYFIGRTGNDVYQSSKPQEPLIFQSKGWQEYNKNGY
ncbi:MAG: RHS repeat-associated core domain-containing protein [Bacteroidota bacterium]|nr:RHS repeat-associated core domain-containing protein [Bacteroidota bacterium]